MLILRSDIG